MDYQPQRQPDSSHPSQIPSQILPTSDGWVVVMCAKDKFYRDLVEIMGAPQLADDPRFQTFADRLRNRETLVPILKDLSRRGTTAEWLARLRGRVPCAPVNTVEEALRDPQVAEDGLVLGIPHPEFGIIQQLASPIKIGDAALEHRRGPKLGEDTETILRDYLKMPLDRINALRRGGVV